NEAECRIAQSVQPRHLERDELLQPRIRARRDESGMELLVQLRERGRIEVLERLDHLRVDRACPLQVVGGEVPRRQGGRAALEDAESFHAVAILGVIDHGHASADVVLELYESFGLELSDRLPHRHDAHLELACDVAEDEPVTGRIGLARDALLDPVIGALRFAEHLRHARSASYSARHCAFMGNRPSTGCPASTFAAIQASSSSWARASSTTSRAIDGGMTMTPSPSPTMMSPGCTAAPPHPIVTSSSHGTCLRP